jgi:quercetin dioxygenase-like cupin family protein
VLRQTVIGMVAGACLSEHENPGEATALILYGRVRLSTAHQSWEGARGYPLIIPDKRHSLDGAGGFGVLLTVAKLS